MILHEKIEAQLPVWRERHKSLAKEHAEVVVDHVTVGQIIGGMRDIKSLVTDISFVDPANGIKFRGIIILTKSFFTEISLKSACETCGFVARESNSGSFMRPQ